MIEKCIDKKYLDFAYNTSDGGGPRHDNDSDIT
jgi:hypothetical protein